MHCSRWRRTNLLAGPEDMFSDIRQFFLCGYVAEKTHGKLDELVGKDFWQTNKRLKVLRWDRSRGLHSVSLMWASQMDTPTLTAYVLTYANLYVGLHRPISDFYSIITFSCHAAATLKTDIQRHRAYIVSWQRLPLLVTTTYSFTAEPRLNTLILMIPPSYRDRMFSSYDVI